MIMQDRGTGQLLNRKERMMKKGVELLKDLLDITGKVAIITGQPEDLGV
jgi:hypothetical protein